MGLEVTLGFPPLDLLAREEAAKAALRVEGRNTKIWDGIGKGAHRGHIFLAHTEWGERDSMNPVYIWKDRPQLDMDSMLTGRHMSKRAPSVIPMEAKCL